MSPNFTKHGRRRAEERGITPEEIDAILLSPDTVAQPSRSDDKAVVVFGMARKRLWAGMSRKTVDPEYYETRSFAGEFADAIKNGALVRAVPDKSILKPPERNTFRKRRARAFLCAFPSR